MDRKNWSWRIALIVAAIVAPCGVVGAARLTFEGSRINDSVTAREGQAVKWRFFTGGPVRYEPEDGRTAPSIHLPSDRSRSGR